MGQIYTFHKSVIGQGHINREQPCEDSSVSYTAEDGRYHIAIIADGHGQEKSFRSKAGSQAAADIALECLKGFAEATLSSPEVENRFYQDILSNPRYRQMTMRQLTNTILAEWSDRIHNDYETNPPSEEELGEYVEHFKDESKRHEVYGTTLLAMLRLPQCMVFLHQGDGRCDVFYEDGSVDQPVPWDPRCEGNQTTSLCDPDAAESFRHLVVDTTAKKIVACYVGSDGVEDAYRSQEGTHAFYRDLSCKLIEKHETDFDAYLEEFLPEFSACGLFSKTGSQDDVSVAGIVDINALTKLIPVFQAEVKRYSLGEDLFWKEDELRSKTRGHGILKKRAKEASDNLEQAKKFFQDLERDRAALISQLGVLQDRIQQAQQELEEDKAGYSSFTGYFQGDQEPKDEEHKKIMRVIKRLSPTSLQDFFNDITNAFSTKEDQYKRMLKEHEDLTDHIKAKEVAIENSKAKIEELQAQADQAKATFDEFDAKYQVISAEIDRLREEIGKLPVSEG